MFKKITKIVCVCSLFAVMLLTAACGAVFGNSTYSKAKDSIVMVYAEDDHGNWGWGTGFAIGEPGKPIQYIATNAHCVLDEGDGSKLYVKVYFSAAANKFMNAEIYWTNTDKDLAVLRLPEKTTEREAMIFCPSNKIEIDQEFYALGYSWTSVIGNDFTKFDKEDIAATRGGIQKQTRINGTDVYLLDVEINQGNSGGPLVNSKGEVVGINTFSLVNPETGQVLARYAVSIDELINNIDRKIIPYTITGEVTTQMIIYIAIGVVILLLIIIFTVMLLGKKKASASISAAMPNVNPSVPVASAAVATPSVKAYIKGINGHFMGRNIEIGSKIIIGRDSGKCTAAFPLDAAGISGIHCEVTFDGTTAYLRDLGSSYGTFLANGTKIAANAAVRLNTGDRFYVASEDNTFEFIIL